MPPSQFFGPMPETIGLGAGPASCSIDGDCPAGMYCSGFGVCLADNCSSSAECGPYRVCWNNLCLPPDQVPAGSECASNAQCPADRMCSAGFCIKRAQRIRITPWAVGGPVNPADPGWTTGFKKTGDEPSPGAKPAAAPPNYYAAALLAAAAATLGTGAASMATRSPAAIAVAGVASAAVGALAGSQL